MTDTVRTVAALQALFADGAASNSTNRQLLRDLLVSLDNEVTVEAANRAAAITASTSGEATTRALFDANIGGINVKNAPYGAIGDGSTDDTTAITNAIAACTAAGGGTVYFPPGTYKVTSSFTIPASVVLAGAGRSASIIKRFHSNDMVTSIGTAAGLRLIRLDGNVGSFPTTGRGVVVATAVGAQDFLMADVVNFPLACLDFAVADAGSEFKSVGCTYFTSGALGSVAAVKVSGTDSQAVPRYFHATTSQGCTLFDFGNCSDFFASGFYTNGLIFGTSASKVYINGMRGGAAAGTYTIKGSSHQFSSTVFAAAVILDSSTAGVNLGDAEVPSWNITDNGTNNRYSLFQDYTGTWTSDGVAPALGNGTLTGFIERDGKKAHLNLKLTFGSTTTFGSGQYFLSLPFADSSSYRYTGTAWIFDSSASTYYSAVARVVPGQSKLSLYFNASSTPWSAAQPVTYATSDEVDVSLTFHVT